MRILPAVQRSLRRVLGQQRQVNQFRHWWLVELRQGAAEDAAFMASLARRLTQGAGVEQVLYVPELERLLLRLPEQDEAFNKEALLEHLAKVETQFKRHRDLFASQTRFPAERSTRLRTVLEMGLDVAGFTSGLLMRQVNERTFRFFSDLSALGTLIEHSEDLRQPLDLWLGEDNSDLLLRLLANLSGSFSQGWSGSLVDLVHRAHQWQEEQDRQQCWESLQEACLTQLSSGLWDAEHPAARPMPMPLGPVEHYQSTADKMSLAAFSTGMAFSHNLTQSFSTWFASAPRPAVMGRNAFCIQVSRELSAQGVLVLETDALERLDRVTCVVLDRALVQEKRLVITAVKRLRDELPALEQLDALLGETEGQKNSPWHLRQVQTDAQVPRALREWFGQTGQALSSLYLVKQGNTLGGGLLVQQVVDHATESLLARIRYQGLKAQLVDGSIAQTRVADLQSRGEVVLALGGSGVIRGADVAVGALRSDAAWPRGAHLLTQDPVSALWHLLDACDLAGKASQQSVELSKIEAFSGLILSLEQLDRRSLGRIRLAANLAALSSMLNGWRLARDIEGMPSTITTDFRPWHAMDVDSVLERLNTAENAVGFVDSESATHKVPGLGQLWLEEMASPLVPVLLTGAGLAAFTGAMGDALLIGGVMAVNGLIGGRQRQQTEQQLRELGMKTEQVYRVERQAETLWLAADELRPGDRLLLETGDVVPADARLLKADHLETDESSLTGESLPVKKRIRPSFELAIAERSSMLWEGTALVQGNAEAVVVAEQARSEARRSQVYTRQRFNGVEARLDRLTELTVPVAAFSGVAILLSGLSRNLPVQEVIGSGVSLAVAAIPEGLPIIATMAQLSAAGRLGHKGALARNPRAIEALGRMTVLCADKTGTLTEGRLALRQIAVDGQVEGIERLSEAAQGVLKTAWMASPEGVGQGQSNHLTDEAVGRAVLEQYPDMGRALVGWQRVKELPFKSERGYHATLWQQERNDGKLLCLKGAPEILVARCNRWKLPDGSVETMDEAARLHVDELAHSLAAKGYRILAVAERPARSLTLGADKVTNLIFCGFLALADPVRQSAKAAVVRLHEAGIGIKMITGDHPVTARAIAQELEIGREKGVLTGEEIDLLNDEELAVRCHEISVFARVTPAQKARIVKALQSEGEVVGMTGDGANDAAAIRLAEVGIALGEDSSIAAQQAADLLVMDARIETIVTAVFEGRALWTSVRDAVALLVGGNLGEIGFTLIAGLLEGQSPLNARQLLLVNTLTDTLPALAVALSKPDELQASQLLEEGPDASLGAALTREIQWRARLTGSVTTVSWMLDRWLRGSESASTVALLTLIGSQLGQTLLVGKGSREVTLSSVGALAALAVVVETPGLNRLFGCQRPGLIGWAGALGGIVLSVAGSAWLPRLEKVAEEQELALKKRVNDWVVKE